MSEEKRKPGRPAKDRFENYDAIMKKAQMLRDLIKSESDVYKLATHDTMVVSQAFDELNSILPDKNSRILSDNASSRLYFAGTFYTAIMRDEYEYMLKGVERLIRYLEVAVPQKEEDEKC